MTVYVGNPQRTGDPGRAGIVVVRLQGSSSEGWARTDGTRIGHPKPTRFEAWAVQLDDEGRLPPYAVCARSRIEYWRLVEDKPSAPETKPTAPAGWLAKLRAAVDKMMGRT